MQYPVIAAKLIGFLEEKTSSGQYAPGFKIPSLRELAVQFELDVGAVRRAVDYLAERGVLEKRPRSGVFVKTSRSAKPRGGFRVHVFIKGESQLSGIFATVLLGVQKAAALKDVQLLQSFNFGSVSPAKLDALVSEADGALLLGADEATAACEGFAPKRPTVCVCSRNTFNGTVSTVDMDPFDSAVLAAGFFKEAGVGKVNIVSANCAAYLTRGELFAAAWAGLGGKSSFLVDHPAPLLKKGEGFLFTTGGAMQEWGAAWAKSSGVKMRDEFVVLGLDGKNRLDPAFEPGPTIGVDWSQAGRFALEDCLYRIENPGASPRRIYLPVSLFK